MKIPSVAVKYHSEYLPSYTNDYSANFLLDTKIPDNIYKGADKLILDNPFLDIINMIAKELAKEGLLLIWES